ncbi:esterase [Streptomyces sp. AA4]|nr:esterase [Streptomyces sp. AA4]
MNEEGQHNLWPDFLAVPEGWRTTFGPDARHACLDYLEQAWADLRPLSLQARDES